MGRLAGGTAALAALAFCIAIVQSGAARLYCRCKALITVVLQRPPKHRSLGRASLKACGKLSEEAERSRFCCEGLARPVQVCSKRTVKEYCPRAPFALVGEGSGAKSSMD